jgi:hypothetical protein
MRKMPLKALVSLLALNRTEGTRPNWDRIVMLASTAVTIGLIALYSDGKASSRW